MKDEGWHVELFQVFCEVRLRESLDAIVMGLNASHHALQPPVLPNALRNLGAGPVVSVERKCNVLVEMRLRKEKLEREISNLTQAIAEGGPSKHLLCEIASREKEISSITDRLLASGPDSVDTRVEDLKREVENGIQTLGSLLRKNAPLAKEELHSHLLGVQMYPALEGEGWCYFAEGTWDLMGNAPVAKDFMQPQNGRFVMVAGAYRELKPPTLSFRYRLAVNWRIPLGFRAFRAGQES